MHLQRPGTIGNNGLPTILVRIAVVFSSNVHTPKGLPRDSSKNRIDVGNVDNPCSTESKGRPGYANNDSKKDKRVQRVQEGQARDKPHAVNSTLKCKDHD